VNSVNGLTDPEGIAHIFVSYFSKACSSNTAAGALRLRQTYKRMRASYVCQNTDKTHRFDAELIENVICNKMRLGKAADLDGITVEHLFYRHRLLPCVLAKLFNLMIHVAHVLRSFGISYTVPILKKITLVFTVNLSQWITSVGSQSVQLYLKYLNTASWIVLGISSCDNQFGFKKHLSCTRAIHSLKAVVDYYIKHDSTVNLCTIDLSKAFDRINHHGLFVKLMQRRIPSKLLYILEQWFLTSSTCVKWGSFISDFFDLKCGVRQGGVLSPYHFAVYIDNVFECVSDCGLGCKIKQYCMARYVYKCQQICLYSNRP